MAKITVELMQCTPILHFQGKIDGATLRGTELKPLLDKALKKADKGKNLEKYKLGKSNAKSDAIRTYDYRIVVSEKNGTKIPVKRKDGDTKVPADAEEMDNLPCKWNINKHTLLDYQTLTLTIYSVYPELLEAIKANIAVFFMVNNFGFGKNKGFGGFCVTKIDGENVTEVSDEAVANALEGKGYHPCIYQIGDSYGNGIDALKKIKEQHADLLYELLSYYERGKTPRMYELFGAPRTPGPLMYKVVPDGVKRKILVYVRDDFRRNNMQKIDQSRKAQKRYSKEEATAK